MSIILDDTLMERRGKLALAVHATYQDQLWKGSDAWRAHQAAKKALDQFDRLSDSYGRLQAMQVVLMRHVRGL